jgi:precorrin-4 methylase
MNDCTNVVRRLWETLAHGLTRQPAAALSPSKRDEALAGNPTIPLRDFRTVVLRTRSPLSIQLSLHTLDEIVRELVPFFGGDCPVRVVYTRSSSLDAYSTEVVQATLANIENISDCSPYTRSAFVLVG